MKFTDEDLKNIILENNLMTEADVAVAEKSAKAQDTDFFQYISEQNLVKDEEIGQLIASFLGIPFVNLKKVSIKDDVLDVIPEIVAHKQKIICFKKDKDGLHVATSKPWNVSIIDFIKKKSGENVVVYYATERNLSDAFNAYTRNATLAFDDILAENIKQARVAKGKSAEPPIIKIVDTIIDYAYGNKASDVHIEPEEDYSLLRFRIDGMLHDIVRLPKEIHEQVVTRIKVLSDLRTDTHHKPQDGKIQKKIYDESLNLRVSIVPVTEGEKVVLRLLSERSRQMTLTDLGFLDESLKLMSKSYKKPYGMVLATGPTGSGKTTTLYAILKAINKREKNIMTIEDPVEYDIEGINQIQVNPKTGLTFATGLRSIVRQDPDVILVGEIRDEETAKIAINSAMTGHQVLSTLHTNDAATTIPRLFDMGVEPFLIASSINVIVGQRLVRRICEECRVSIDLDEKKREDYTKGLPKDLVEKHFGGSKTIRVYKGKGCDLCHGTGYQGRIGIYEVLEVEDKIRKGVINKFSAEDIKNIAVENGMVTMLEDGLEKVKMGITTLEELIRVTKE